MRFFLFCCFCLLLLMGLVVWPQADLFVSGFFYNAELGFVWRNAPLLQILTTTAFWGARILAVCLLLAASFCWWKKRSLFQIDAKGWVFLITALLIGPGLVANATFKDNWGRARPRDVVAFGGTSGFSPAFVMADQCRKNCSFISGDASFGFILPCLAFVVPPKRRKRVFWGALAVGSLFGLGRLFSGAHFLSDVLSAALFMGLVGTFLHALFYGKIATREVWRSFLVSCLLLLFLMPQTAWARENTPDPRLTPGEVLTTDITLVCQHGYSKTVRKTTIEMKREAYRAYEIKNHTHYKIDHLVPLSLGGADSMANIWPADFTTEHHTADDKDRFELKARHLVCTHQLSVEAAQKIFMTDWKTGYDRYCQTRKDCPSFEEIQEQNLPFP